jgi:hypothetical protein
MCLVSRGGRRERIAVRLNAILRKLPKNASLDGKQWHAETSARRSLMRHIVGIVGRLIEEEDERANDRRLADERLPEEGTTIDLCGTPVHVKPGDTITIRPTGAAAETQRIPVERVIVAGDVGASTQGPEVGACGWCGKILPTSGDCPCIPF